MEVGMKVLLENTWEKERKGGKLADRWLGPYVINKDCGKGLFELKDVNDVVMKKKSNYSHLKV